MEILRGGFGARVPLSSAAATAASDCERMESGSVMSYLLMAGCAPALAALIPVFFLRNGLTPRALKIVLSISAGLLFAIATTDLIPEAIAMGTEHSHATAEQDHDHELLVRETGNVKAAMFGIGFGFFLLLLMEQMLHAQGLTHSHSPPTSSAAQHDHRHDDHKHSSVPVGNTAGVTVVVGSVPSVIAGSSSSASSNVVVTGVSTNTQPCSGTNDPSSVTVSASFTLVALVGMAVHSLIDGLVIASGFAASTSIGSRVAVAIVIHKFPDGFVLSGLLGSGGPLNKRSMYSLALVLGMTPIGAILGSILLGHIPSYILPFVLGCGAGTFLFISTTAVLPEIMHLRPTKFSDVFWVIGGYAGFIFAEALLGSAHQH